MVLWNHLFTKKYDTACRKNKITIVKHLLETPSLRNLIQIDFERIKSVFEEGDYELGDYLLNQPQKEEIMSYVFAMACFNRSLKNVRDLFYTDKYKDLISVNYNST